MKTQNTDQARLAAWRTALFLLMISLFPVSLPAAGQQGTDSEDFSQDLTELSIEDLMNLEVTTFSRKAQKLSNTAAAVFVITREDIRRSGAVNIAEILRMAPGIQVARIDAAKWAISARGFNGRFANKLLVLMDGRSLYSPLYSGVFWNVQDTLLEDIERIEIIRGPGASTWGANAVNGIINIITQKASDTRGGLVSAGGGTEEKSFGSARYGATIHETADIRMYAKYTDRDGAVYASGEESPDDWNISQGGFRSDWQVSTRNALTLQGDLYNSNAGQDITLATLDPPYSINFDDKNDMYGGNLMAKWAHTYSATSEMITSVYYDRSTFKESVGKLKVETFDLDFQHQFVLSDRHEIVWGGGFRRIQDRLKSSFNVSWGDESDHIHIFSAFIQDDITLSPNKWRLTLGSKFEHNSYTDFEIQPTARILWTPGPTHSIWGSVSRAVRTPSRGDRDATYVAAVIPPGQAGNSSSLPMVVVSSGGDQFDSEELLAFEIGYRTTPNRALSLDTAAFYNLYDGVRSFSTGAPYTEPQPIPDRLIVPSNISGSLFGKTYGFELAADWRMLDWWRLQASYSWLQIDLKLHSGSTAYTSLAAEDESPHHQISLRSSTDLTRTLELDLWLRYVDELPAQNVDRYITLDARLGWHLLPNLEISLVGRNLLDNHHPEFKPEFVNTASTEVERSVYAKATWTF